MASKRKQGYMTALNGPKKDAAPAPNSQLRDVLAVKECDSAHRLVDAHPNAFSYDDLYDVAKCYYHQKLFSITQPLIQKLIAAPSAPAVIHAKSLYALAKIAYTTGQSWLALDEYEKKFQHNLSDVDSLCQFARLSLTDSRRQPESDVMIQYIFQSAPRDPWTYICLAEYARESALLPNAAAIAETSCRAVIASPGFEDKGFECLRSNITPFSPLMLSAVNPTDEMKEMAMQYMASAIDREQQEYWWNRYFANPNDVSVLQALVDYYDTSSRRVEYKDQHPMVADALEMILAQDLPLSKRITALNQLGAVYFLAGQRDVAQTAWDRLAKVDDTTVVFAINQTVVALVGHRYDEAIDSLTQANVVPGMYHRLASNLKIADFLATKDYSRVGKESAKAFAQALEWCDAHLKLYPNDEVIWFFHEYANWRVQENQSDPQKIVTEWTDKLIKAGQQWKNPLAIAYLTYGALAYMHRGKVEMGIETLAPQAAADFDKAESILLEIFNHKDKVLASDDPLGASSLMEAWLSYGWSKYNRGDHEAAEKIFSAVVNAKEWPEDKTQSESFYDWPKLKILPKQLIEAYRGLGTSRDQGARAQFKKANKKDENGKFVLSPEDRAKALQTAAEHSTQAVQFLDEALKIERPFIEGEPIQFSHNVDPEIIDGDRRTLVSEEESCAGASYLTYIQYFDHAVHSEAAFNHAVALYWNAKILNGGGKVDAAQGLYAKAEQEFKEVLKAAPDHPETYRWLEYIALVKGDVDEAVKMYDEAHRLGTDQLADAIEKLRDGYDAQLKSDSLAMDKIALRNFYKIKRAHYTIALADVDPNPKHLEDAIAYAKDLADSIICDPTSSYQKELQTLVTDGMAMPAKLTAFERKRRGQNHSRILSVLGDCLKRVSLAPAKR